MLKHLPILPFHLWLAAAALSLILLIIPATRIPGFILFCHILPLIVLGVLRLRMQFFGKTFCSGTKNSGLIALTFDDGPDPALTPAVLALLARHAMPATFFVVARRAEQHPQLLRDIAAAGHAIACHDLDHRLNANFRLRRGFMRDIGEAREIILNIVGTYPRLYRPPVGLSNPHLFGVLRHYTMDCIGWNRSGADAGNRSARGIAKIGTLAQEGAIVLLHDVLPKPEHKELFLEQLDMLCSDIEKQGLRAVTLGELLGLDE